MAGEDWRRVVALSRLVVVPGEPQNAASFLIGRSIRLIRCDGRFKTLLTYADKRMGHTGAIYRATNWTCLGETRGDEVFVDQKGRQVARLATKSRTRSQMLEAGYTSLGRHGKVKFVMHL